MDDFLSYAIKTFVIYVFTYFGARVLPERTIAQMSAFDLAGIMLFTTIAVEPLVTKVTVKALFGTGFIIILMLVTGRLALIDKLNPIIEHTPLILIENGKIDLQALKAATLSLNQLQGLLRQKGYEKMEDIDHAILETQGQLSVFPKSDKRAVQPKDLNIKPPAEGLTLPLIMDSMIIESNLRHIGMTREHLLCTLKQQGVIDYKKQVTLVQYESSGNLLINWSDKENKQ